MLTRSLPSPGCRHLSTPLLGAVLAMLALPIPRLAAAAEPSGKVRFNEQIRPILSDMCFHCHGPDDKTRDADLRLDTREGALENRAVVPGKPDESELMVRILSHDRSEMMPPPKAKKPSLTEAQVATIRRWIEQGAEYEGHWAFLPLRQTPPPAPKNEAWSRNGVDRFILTRLEKEGIQPSAEADRGTLIRRVSLDLTGLLPTPAEVRAFEKDTDPLAYERLVDRLLDSPHYGERWGRHWLDQARYADSNGYTIDGERGMWPFRDWVIKSLNDDLPFDRFTIEQLAGDLLPKPTRNQLIATAFHRNTLINEEGGTDPEQFRVEAVMDRVNTTGAVWLGLTVGCAQCHTHKFDPITHEDYYRMYAFFNQGTDVNNKGTTMEVGKGEVFGKMVKATPEPAPLAKRAKTPASTQVPAPDVTHTRLASLMWQPVEYLEYDTTANAGLKLLPDNSLLADGGGSFNDTYRVVAKSSLKKIAAVRLRVLTHESLPKGGPGLAGNGNFVLTDVEISVGGRELPVKLASADHFQPNYPAQAAADGDAKTGWAINVAKSSATGARMNADHDAVFVLEQPVSLDGQQLEVRLHHDLNEKYLVGRFALDVVEAVPDLPRSAPVVATAPNTLTTAAKKTKPGATGDSAELMIMKDLENPRQTFLFQRGDFLRPDQKLGPLTPGVIAAVLAAMPESQRPQHFQSRLDLAQWLVNPSNPLTPRVTMNRLWMHYFGRGIVETEEDFGSQGSAPVHPELLDWLAGEFIRQGWSFKAMHRLVVNSATYRQSSRNRPDLAEKDPRNLLLARQERVRVEAEIIRDAGLCASGLLNPAVGGPSVRPPQPEGVYSFTQNKKNWITSVGPDRYRRGMYTLFYRSAPHPLFTTFDAPDFQQVCTRRSRSNTPLQALTVANDEAFVEMARAMAARLCKELPGPVYAGLREGRILLACRIAYSRGPSLEELKLLQKLSTDLLGEYEKDRAAAEAAWGPQPLPDNVALAEAAALVSVTRAILNTDAFVTRE